MHICRCRDCGACFSSLKFGCADRFRTNNARPHIKNLLILLYHLRCLQSTRKLLGQDVMIQLMCILVLSRPDYFNSVLAGLPASTLAPLQRVLHAAARLVNDLKTSDHVTSMLVDLHWLPIKQRVDYKLCCHVHNVSIGHAPAYLSDMLTSCAEVPSFSRLRTSSSGDYVIPRMRLKLGERAFAVSAPLAWNNLLREFKKTKCTLTFKRLLKTFYSNQRIFRTDYVLCLQSTSRRRTKSHHVMLNYYYLAITSIIISNQ